MITRLVHRSRFVGRSRLVFLSVSRVLHISNVSRVSISNSVGHSLGTTVRKKNAVLTIGSVSVPGFLLVVVQSGVIINNSIVVSIVGRLFFVGRGGFVGGSRGIRGGGSVDIVGGSNGQKSKSNKSLK